MIAAKTQTIRLETISFGVWWHRRSRSRRWAVRTRRRRRREKWERRRVDHNSGPMSTTCTTNHNSVAMNNTRHSQLSVSRFAHPKKHHLLPRTLPPFDRFQHTIFLYRSHIDLTLFTTLNLVSIRSFGSIDRQSVRHLTYLKQFSIRSFVFHFFVWFQEAERFWFSKTVSFHLLFLNSFSLLFERKSLANANTNNGCEMIKGPAHSLFIGGTPVPFKRTWINEVYTFFLSPNKTSISVFFLVNDESSSLCFVALCCSLKSSNHDCDRFFLFHIFLLVNEIWPTLCFTPPFLSLSIKFVFKLILTCLVWNRQLLLIGRFQSLTDKFAFRWTHFLPFRAISRRLIWSRQLQFINVPLILCSINCRHTLFFLGSIFLLLLSIAEFILALFSACRHRMCHHIFSSSLD